VTRTLTSRIGTPRLIVRTLVGTFGAILLILAAVFVVLTIEMRTWAARSVAADLETTERIFSAVEDHRREQLTLQLANVAQTPDLLNAVFLLETTRNPAVRALPALRRHLHAAARRLGHATLFVADAAGTIIASAGPHQHAWRHGTVVPSTLTSMLADDQERIVQRPGGVFRVLAVPVAGPHPAGGALYAATAVDDAYAAELAGVTRTQVAVTLGGQLLGTTLPEEPRIALGAAALAGRLPAAGRLDLDGERFEVRRVLAAGPLQLHAVDSVDRSLRHAHLEAFDVLAVVALGALLLGAGASLWLARSVARPIDALSRQLRDMTLARDFSRALPATGSSRELDELTTTFNQLISSLASAEQQTELAYVGAIKALAAALDCRDPYTAGHSERVSALSVMIGRQLGLDAEQLDILRLGALLHDIGKIGVHDSVLTKPGPLTAGEFEIIKMHPTIGGHILRQVPFLSRHLPIVELHHERPDGRGYPHGLLNHATPLLARIVHVADAFDAMTTARAYRGAGTPSQAIAELWRYAGTQFDAEVVEAFVAAWSALPVGEGAAGAAALPVRPHTVLPFPARKDVVDEALEGRPVRA
jgi:putative nucleotidyltransferase with HDIG domain